MTLKPLASQYAPFRAREGASLKSVGVTVLDNKKQLDLLPSFTFQLEETSQIGQRYVFTRDARRSKIAPARITSKYDGPRHLGGLA